MSKFKKITEKLNKQNYGSLVDKAAQEEFYI